MQNVRAFPANEELFEWLVGEERPFTVHKIDELSGQVLFFNPKKCYDECCHAMANGCKEAHSYNSNPFAYQLLVIARDNAEYGVDVVAVYKEG